MKLLVAAAIALCGYSVFAQVLPTATIFPPFQRAIDTGSSLNFTSTVSGTPPLNYQWLLNGAKISGATTNFFSLVNIRTNQAGNYALQVFNAYGSITSSIVSVLVYPTQTTVFSDSFETNSAANWTVNKSSGDLAVAFSFNYSTLGIPSAPHSSGGTTLGVQLKANLTLGVVAAISISPTNQSFSGDYRLHFDAWINSNGPFPAGGASSTEFLTAGIGTAGNRVEWTGSGSTADGYYFSADGDGGVSATSTTTGDYSGYIGKTWQNAASGIYAAGSLDNLNSYYTNAFSSGITAPALQQSSYAQQTGAINSGALGFAWHDVIVSRRGSTVDWVVDGIRLATISNATLTTSNVCVGFWDPFASLTDNTNLSFGLIDNLRVEAPLNSGPTTNQFLTAYDLGAGFFNGEDVALANSAGLNLYVWSSPYPSISVFNWTLEGQMSEQPFVGSSSSRYSINLNPTNSPTYYIFSTTNTTPFAAIEPVLWLSTSDFVDFTVTGSNVTITADGVLALPSPPVILVPPAATNVFAGRSASLSVTATGSGTLGYQWVNNNNLALTDGGSLSGAHTNALNIFPATTDLTGNYSVVVTNSLGSATSSAAMFNVVSLPPLYLTYAADNLTVAADGGAVSNRYFVEVATNLASPVVWTPIVTNVIGASGQIRFTETNANNPQRFYRLHFP